MDDGKVEIALGVDGGRVAMQWHEPTRRIEFDPENARIFAEHLARAAYEASSGIAWDKRHKALPAQVRQKLVTRSIHIMREGGRKGRAYALTADILVDMILSAVT